MLKNMVDLHMHSKYSSDGTFSVQEIFKQANENGMSAIVIADHDTLEGVEEAIEESLKTGILTVPAIELSCIDENRMVHILGYGVDLDETTKLGEIIKKIQQSRIDILPKIKENLENIGFFVDLDRVKKLAFPHPPVITNFANEILTDPRNKNNDKLSDYREGNSKSDNPYIQFIRDYLVAGKECYVPEYIVDIYTGIQAIKEANGVPVLAHPGEWFSVSDEWKLPKMKDAGLMGIEVFTPYHTTEKELYFKQLADKYKLFKTAGSDYHDIEKKPGHMMGEVNNADMQMFFQLKQMIEDVKNEV